MSSPLSAQAEIADDYISDQFLVDNFGGAGGSNLPLPYPNRTPTPNTAPTPLTLSHEPGGAGGSGSADYGSIEGFAGMADLGSIDAAI